MIFIILLTTLLLQVECDITLSQLESIMSPCGLEKSIAPKENISCNEAIQFVNQAINTYHLNTSSLQAMYLSTISLESGNLTFNKNHYPGRPGQGTRGMLMPDVLLRFVNSPTNKGILNKCITRLGEAGEANSKAILNFLMNNRYSFLPAAWFILEGCSNSYDLVKSGKRENVVTYLKSCLGGSDVEGRYNLYLKALEILQQ